MSNPKENNSLPTPENPNNGFSIEVKNADKIYDLLVNRDFQNGGLIDGRHVEDILGDIKIGDNIIRNIYFGLRGTDNELHYSQDYSFVFDISNQTRIGNDQDVNASFDENKRYFNKQKVEKIMSELSFFGELPTYCVNSLGDQTIKFNKFGNTYVFNCGFPSLEDHWLWNKNFNSKYGTNNEESFKKNASKSDLYIYMENQNIKSEHLYDHYFPLCSREDFIKSINNFSEVCELLVKCLYGSSNEIMDPQKLLVDFPKRSPYSKYGKGDFQISQKSKICDDSNLKKEKNIKSVVQKSENIIFSDIAGQSRAVAEAKKLVLAINHPEIYEKRGVKTPKGILFYGPPGTGKTLIAKAIASEVNAELFEVSFSDIGSKWYGESEKRIQEIFDQANNVTKNGKKTIILFDELDSMAPSRIDSYEGSKKIVSIILQNLDGFRSNKNVLIIGTTNRPEDIDPALKRPGRIDKIIAVDLPEIDDRKAILELHINKAKKNASESHDLFSPNLDIQKIAEGTEGMSGADLANIINLTLETKTVLELEGLRWTPISNADIERTLVEFNLKKKEKNRIGFQA